MDSGRTRLPLGAAWWASLAALAAVLGCGGSGSSGFDPAFLEGLVIEQAIEQQTCLPRGELTICAAGATSGVGPPGVPGVGGLRLDATVDRSGYDACARAGLEACRVNVGVTGEGVPAGAELRVAVRLVPDGAWQVGEAFDLPATSGPFDTPTPIPLDVRPSTDAGGELQLAVLVFVGPTAVPSEVEELASTGARWAFVVTLGAET
ncbi:MAG: hypothetical protein AB1689_04845 [Thermodesulfobacteriota bacterium]